MFMNVLIITFASLTIILIAIKYGLLEILAIILSLVAIIPIAIAVISYFANRPVISFLVTSKSIEKSDDENIYRFSLSINSNEAPTIVSNIYISSEFGYIPENAPGSTASLSYVHSLEEMGFGFIAKVGDSDFPLFPKHGYGYLLQLRTKEKNNKLLLKLIIDTSADPMKQGIFSIFSNLYKYRFMKEIELDYENLDNQEGTLNSIYF